LIVVDASIAVGWFVPEEHSAFASELLLTPRDLIAPDLLVAEVGNALVKANRRGLIRSERVRGAVRRLTLGLVTLDATSPLLPEASDLACRLRCSIYDAVYIELARRAGALLVTNDTRQAELAVTVAVRVHRPRDGPLPS
jgi:predicted nucleic acid-binding protein